MTSIIRDAATVVLLRESRQSPEVYLVRRSSRAAFMPDLYVYPGGAVDRQDQHLAAPTLSPDDVAALDASGRQALRVGGLRVAAIRECFEEAGVLLSAGPTPSAGVLAEWRTRLNSKSHTFADMCAALGLSLRPSDLLFFDHWITPSFKARRFDARFYLAVMPAGQAASEDAAEVYDGDWWTPDAALRAHADGMMGLAPPTFCTLEALAGHDSVGALLSWAQTRRVVPILPQLLDEGDGPVLLLPGDPQYPSVKPTTPPFRIRNIDGRWVRGA
ncbi:MAG: 8-oxo-dGTP pyrophosphatase MutT (NUDIX family) [Flavobacteriales bacterium]|jgi:8-oxo-dGTP pyrophosphatase MutT (NUDIX family)